MMISTCIGYIVGNQTSQIASLQNKTLHTIANHRETIHKPMPNWIIDNL